MQFSKLEKISGDLSLPGDKSISHRALFFSSLAYGSSSVKNLSDSDDVKVTIDCLSKLNAGFESGSHSLKVRGVGKNGFKPCELVLYCGNSGTTARLICGILAAQNFPITITGDESLSSRPMNRVIEPLEKMGCRIKSKNGKLPLQLNPTEQINAIEYVLPVASAQIKGAVLIAGLHSGETTTVVENSLYIRDHTERMLKLPVEIINNKKYTKVSGQYYPTPAEYFIPGDISTAVFFIVLTALSKNSELVLNDVSLNKSRTAILDVLKMMGTNLTVEETGESGNEPFGNIIVKSSTLNNINIEPEIIPAIIDEIPILSVAGVFAEGEFEIKGAKELRVKESDRINSVCKNLQTAGLSVDEFEDGFVCSGSVDDTFHNFESFGDHRIAMAFGVMSSLLGSGGNVNGFDCVRFSNPGFLNQLKKITVR